MKKFLIKYKGLLKVIAATAIAAVVFLIAHKLATNWRGYEAIGGELFLFFLILFAEDIAEIIKKPFKAVFKNADM